MHVSTHRTGASLAALLTVGFPAWSQQAQPTQAEVELELLELLNTPVTGASKREQRLMDSPQAIEVLTGDEIRQMGIYRIQDALKLITGVDILEPDSGFSGVGMRGVMQQGQPRTVQVLIDGVALYNAFASSIDINNLPVTIDAIDRIEVVRGPSSTLYGANAVVGVIAITTKKAGHGTHGDARIAKADKGTARWSADIGTGNGQFGITAGYQGASFGCTGRTAFYVGDTTHSAPVVLDAENSPDWSHQASGFARADWKNDHTSLWLSAGEGDKKVGLSQGLQSRSYDNKTLLAGWREAWSDVFATEIRLHQVQSTFHYHMIDSVAQNYNQARLLMGWTPVDISGNYKLGDVTTSQVEVQANWDPNKDLHFVFGADTRKVDAEKSLFLGFANKESETASGVFASMDWTLAKGWTLSLGARTENEGLGGSRTSPRATLVWSPTPTSVFRLGYFTSTRSPQMAEQNLDYSFPYSNPANPSAQPPLYLQATRILPNARLNPEKTTNFELGYRQSIGQVTLDCTIYQMKISDQITQVITGTQIQTVVIPTGLPAPYPPYVTEDVPVYLQQFQNRGSATNRGVELALAWTIQKDWKAGLNGRYLDYTQDDKANATGPASWNGEFSYAPKHVITAWTRFSRGRFSGYADVQHIASSHVEALTATSFTLFDERPAYFQCDVQLGYEFVKGFSVSLYARNAAREYTLQGGAGPDRPPAYQIQRRELGCSLTYRF